jgi:hypothetical protein
LLAHRRTFHLYTRARTYHRRARWDSLSETDREVGSFGLSEHPSGTTERPRRWIPPSISRILVAFSAAISDATQTKDDLLILSIQQDNGGAEVAFAGLGAELRAADQPELF